MSRLLLNGQNSAYGLLSALLRTGNDSWSASQVIFGLGSQECCRKMISSYRHISPAVGIKVGEVGFEHARAGKVMISCNLLLFELPFSLSVAGKTVPNQYFYKLCSANPKGFTTML